MPIRSKTPDPGKLKFRPQLNKKSLLMAEKLEPSFERLTKNKDKLQNISILTNPKINTNSIQLDPFKNKNKDNTNNINRYEIL